eukprot:2107494-Amphidinium_carterae.1
MVSRSKSFWYNETETVTPALVEAGCVARHRANNGDLTPAQQKRHGGYLGVRVGEASNPGPGGSRRTARRRNQTMNAA